jgi:hypothetical protein
MKECMSCGAPVPDDMEHSLCPSCYETPLVVNLYRDGVAPEPGEEAIAMVAFQRDEFDNMLVRQKEHILRTLDSSPDHRAICVTAALQSLITVSEILDRCEKYLSEAFPRELEAIVRLRGNITNIRQMIKHFEDRKTQTQG